MSQQPDYDRLQSVLDVEQLAHKHVAAIGVGGSATLVCNLARCGVRQFTLVDYDVVEAVNIARQGHDATTIGMSKAEALKEAILRIQSRAKIEVINRDFTSFSNEEIDLCFGHADLFLFTTDSFAAQAKGNQVALRLGKPALWIGLYRHSGAGEIVFWHPKLKPCFRCLMSKRYAAFAQAHASGDTFDSSSQGADVFSLAILDGIAGQLALGLLTQGADNRFGRLVDQLGDRQFLQVKLDPTWTLQGRDVVREQLNIPVWVDTYFAWNTIARRDPDQGEPRCPDCEEDFQRLLATCIN